MNEWVSDSFPALGALCLLLAFLIFLCDDFSILYTLFCHMWLLSVRNLFFPKGSGSGREERWEKNFEE